MRQSVREALLSLHETSLPLYRNKLTMYNITCSNSIEPAPVETPRGSATFILIKKCLLTLRFIESNSNKALSIKDGQGAATPGTQVQTQYHTYLHIYDT